MVASGSGWPLGKNRRPTVGDAVHQADSTTGMVQAVVVVQRSQPMYNFTVAVAHTFFVGDQQWLVHNTCDPYEVGKYKDLVNKSDPFDDLDIHHLPQKHPAGQIVPGYNPKDGPAIALPKAEHKSIPTQKGSYPGTIDDLLEKDFTDLFDFTGAPDNVKQQLLDLFDQLFPGVLK